MRNIWSLMVRFDFFDVFNLIFACITKCFASGATYGRLSRKLVRGPYNFEEDHITFHNVHDYLYEMQRSKQSLNVHTQII